MIISVINLTDGQLTDEEVQQASRAINRQIAEDFEPYWSLGATVRLEGETGSQPTPQDPADMRGDAVLYLWNMTDVPGALGYHDRNNNGIPFGVVFTELSEQVGESWTVTLSHEALELIADPEVNLLVAGPHPGDPTKEVFHWYEMCDAVQAETYKIDGVEVSNFVLPLYFTGGEEGGGRNDFLGRAHQGKTLQSYGINPGGYVGFFNPETGQDETFAIRDDAVAARRLEIKLKAEGARRALRRATRYQRIGATARQRGEPAVPDRRRPVVRLRAMPRS
jgi:hypothetical protein